MWWQAAEMIGISDRQLRRWRKRYGDQGYDGLLDRRRGVPSSKRVPKAQAEQVLGLYREQYFDLNVRHFHEKLSEEHQIGLSYTWVKQALQGAGLVKRKWKRGVHRKRRERRPLPGMMLHIDGSHHQWFQDERWHDLIVILDDATSEIYYAQLVQEETTATVMVGLRAVMERKGVFCSLYSDRGAHFWFTPKTGGKVDAGTGSADDRSLFAPGAGTVGTQLLHLARATATGVATARDQDAGSGQRISFRALRSRDQPQVQSRGLAAWHRVPALPAQEPGPNLLSSLRAHRRPG